MTVIDGWYSAALVVKYNWVVFVIAYFFKKCAVRFLKKVMYNDQFRDISSLVASLRKHCTTFRSDALAPYTGSP